MANTTKNHFPLKARLAGMGFLEFAVWGSYLTSLGAYLAHIGMGSHIGWFYAVQGIVSIFMPGLVGIVADRWIQAQKVLSLCHLLAGAFMLGAGVYGLSAAEPSFSVLFALYTVSVAFFMPTIGLSNAVAYSALEGVGLDSVKHFPPIRVFGTIGFICAMLFVNFTGFQNTAMQMVCSGILSFVLCLYALTMPKCPVSKGGARKDLASSLGLDAFKLFRNPRMAGFFIFSMLLGVSLQITNGFANPFIQSFGQVSEYQGTFGVDNANALISLSQMSETLCILLIPFFLKRFGIKIVMLMAMFAWVLRFGFFGIGNTSSSGITFLILSCIVYGVAFDFFNVSGGLYVDSKTDTSMRSSAQGLFMLMTNGIGATVGTLSAQAVVNSYTDANGVTQWAPCWLIFAGYALVVAVSFAVIFRPKKA